MAHAASETPARVTWVAVPLRGSQTGTHRRSTPGQAEGSWVPDPCFLSSSPPPPACAVALTLQQTPLGQRLQQEKKKNSTHPAWRTAGREPGKPASTHLDVCDTDGGRHPNDLAAQKSLSWGLRQLWTRNAPFPRPGLQPPPFPALRVLAWVTQVPLLPRSQLGLHHCGGGGQMGSTGILGRGRAQGGEWGRMACGVCGVGSWGEWPAVHFAPLLSSQTTGL